MHLGRLVEVKSANSRLVPMQTRALELARKHGIETTILRVKFNVKFDHGELYEMNSSRDVRVVNNLPHGTLGQACSCTVCRLLLRH